MASERFEFGKNWQDFVSRHLNEERQRQARESLTSFLQVDNLQGKTFLDVGCGSGLFSLAAHQLGARWITSFDYDLRSVECTRRLRESAGAPPQWTVLQGSVLDPEFLARLERADIVYAWGCLHHTGEMWTAIRNAAELVAENGLFYLAIYNRMNGSRGSEYWARIKRRYNQASPPMRRLMELTFMGLNAVMLPLLRLENPVSYVRSFSGRSRGMNLWIDLKDWLGGYPYECATADEMVRFLHDDLQFALVNQKTVRNLDNNEFVFRRTGGSRLQPVTPLNTP